MKYFFFKQKRNKVQDPKLKDRLVREFMVNAENRERAILKHSSLDHANNLNLLTIKDVEDLYDIADYNYAIHGPVPELYGKEE